MSTKIAFISGGTGGIGFQVAKRLGQDGYIVILNGIEDAKGTECVAQLYNAGIKAEYYGFDVTDEHAVNENINAIGEKYGKIDVIVNNAGGLATAAQLKVWKQNFSVKLWR